MIHSETTENEVKPQPRCELPRPLASEFDPIFSPFPPPRPQLLRHDRTDRPLWLGVSTAMERLQGLVWTPNE